MTTGENITGEQLLALSKKHVPREMLRQAMGEEHFRDFMRIVIFMSLTGILSKQEQSFGHVLVLRGKDGINVAVEFDVKVTPRVAQ